MTEWFRLWHGAPTDPKWRTVARRASVRPGDVWAVVSCLMDRASQASERGCVSGYDVEIIADALGYEPEDVQRIIDALHDKAVIVSGRLADWSRIREPGPRDRPSPTVWQSLRGAVFERDDYRCTYCGGRGGRLECDHIVPVSRGGRHDLGNLTTACFSCNRQKRNRTPDEWRRSA